MCIQTLLNQANQLLKMKPNDTNTYRVVVMISIADLWRSQIIIFKNDDYFHTFFHRNSELQKWIPLSNESVFWEKWGIKIWHTVKTLHFQEIIHDEDECSKKEIWFIGELA